LIYLGSVLVLICSYYLFYKVAGTMAINRLNLMSVIFYYYFIVCTFIGGNLIYSKIGFNPVLAMVGDETRLIGLYSIWYMMLAFPLGALLAQKVFKIKNIKFFTTSYSESKMSHVISPKDSYLRVGLYLMSVISILSALYVTAVMGGVPQLNFFRNLSHSDILALRVSSARGFGGVIYIKTIFFEQLPTLLLLISYAYFQKTKLIKDRFWFYLMLLLSIYSSTFSLSKGPLIGLLVSMFLMRIYINGKVSMKGVLGVLALVLGLLIIMFKLVTNNSMELIFFYLISRIFIDQVSGMYLMFEIFPKEFDFIGFQSISRVISEIFFGGYSEPATRISMEYAFPVATASGQMNLLSTLFLGEAWANFGYVGVVLAPLYIGFIVGLFYYGILKNKKTPIMVALLTYCSFGVSLTSQFNSYVYNALLWIVLLILLFVYILAVVLKVVMRERDET
jgi:oligosaccharide repeat unit polymerase